MESVVHSIAAVLLLIGGFFVFVGSVGLLKLPDFFTRLHAPTKATTLGVGGALIGSMLYFNMIEGEISFHELLITLFLFLTAPITANFIAKTYMQAFVRNSDLPETGRRYGWAVYDDPPNEDNIN